MTGPLDNMRLAMSNEEGKTFVVNGLILLIVSGRWISLNPCWQVSYEVFCHSNSPFEMVSG